VPDADPLLDPPSWVPGWLSVDDVRTMRWLRRALVLVFAAGLAACVTESANSPADPSLEGADGGAAAPSELAERFGTIVAELTAASGAVLELCLLDADVADERRQGLKGVTDLEGHDGMLFRWDDDTVGNFVMIDTVTPLTISWWAADGSWVGGDDMVPCTEGDAGDCLRYNPGAPYRYAVEVFRGELPEAGPEATLEPRIGSSCQRA
jgi:uncharacterized membrane protein (UPF0127 family)